MTGRETQAAYKAVDAFNAEITEAGHGCSAAGSEPPETATVVDNTKGEVTITDGPFIEGKEWLGGFWVVELPRPGCRPGVGPGGDQPLHGAVEVRPFQEDRVTCPRSPTWTRPRSSGSSGRSPGVR